VEEEQGLAPAKPVVLEELAEVEMAQQMAVLVL
jgi:hypothetical protein